MTRSAFREHVFKILFRYEFHDSDEFTDQINMYFEDYPDITDDEKKEISDRIEDIILHMADINSKLSEICDKWKTDRIGKAELSILRVAIYEILYDENIEPAVSINEAVVISKKYCDEKAHSFINGVLAKLIK